MFILEFYTLVCFDCAEHAEKVGLLLTRFDAFLPPRRLFECRNNTTTDFSESFVELVEFYDR